MLHNWKSTRGFKQTIYPIGSFICQETLYKRMSTIKIEHRQEKIGMILWYKNDKENLFNSHHMFSFNSKFMHWIKEKSPLLFVPSFKYSHRSCYHIVFSIYKTFLFFFSCIVSFLKFHFIIVGSVESSLSPTTTI